MQVCEADAMHLVDEGQCHRLTGRHVRAEKPCIEKLPFRDLAHTLNTFHFIVPYFQADVAYNGVAHP